MLCIYHESTDPYFNIATDEYILKYMEEDCFMLWRNDNAIIVGKYQNTLSEINYDYVRENNISVVRRMSGGGAVYHDLGNLNFLLPKAERILILPILRNSPNLSWMSSVHWVWMLVLKERMT